MGMYSKGKAKKDLERLRAKGNPKPGEAKRSEASKSKDSKPSAKKGPR